MAQNLFRRMRLSLECLYKRQSGQDLTEYGLLVGLIAIVVVLSIAFFGDQVSAYFSQLGVTLQSWLS